MADLAFIALLPLVFGLTALGPGVLIVRRTRWEPLEKITAALALSLLAAGQASFLIFALGLHPMLRMALLAASAGCLWLARREIASWASGPARQETRRAVLSYLALAVWCIALLALVRNYAGGAWYGDWVEHFDRSRLFLGGLPLDQTFQGYSLPARPPLINLIAAHLMALTRIRYAGYQVAMTLVGTLVFFPVLLLARLFNPASRRLPILVAIHLMFLPLVAQNATFAWTKLGAAFFVLTGMAFYAAGLRRNDSGRVVMAFACLFGGILAHYSAVPYALFVGLHWIGFVVPKRAREQIGPAAAILLAAVLVLLPWHLFSLRVYGAGATVSSNSSWRDAAPQSGGENLMKSAGNLLDTLIPVTAREWRAEPIGQQISWGTLHDAAFKCYQGNLPLSLGSLGAALLLYDLMSRRRQGRPPAGERRFWIAWAVLITLAGVAVYGGRERLGLAHITLQPLTLAGVAFLASQFEARTRAVRWLAWSGLVLDALLGIVLHVFLESYPLGIADQAIRFPGLTMADLRVESAEHNWLLKGDRGLTFLGDRLAPMSGVAWCVVILLFLAAAAWLARVAARGEDPAPDKPPLPGLTGDGR